MTRTRRILNPWQSLGREYKEGGKDISRFTGSSKMTPMLLKGLTSVWYSILWKVATFQLIDPILKNRETSAIEHTSSVVESKWGAGVLSFCQAVWKIENCQAIWSMKIENKIVAQLEIGAKWCFDQFEIPRINIFLLLKNSCAGPKFSGSRGKEIRCRLQKSLVFCQNVQTGF